MDDLDVVAAELVAAGLLVVEGDELRLTPEGEALGRLLAMGWTDEADAVFEALLSDEEG